MDALQESSATVTPESSNAGLKTARTEGSNKAEAEMPAADIKTDDPTAATPQAQEEAKPKVQLKQRDKRRHSHHQKPKHKGKKPSKKDTSSDASDSDSDSSDSSDSDSDSDSDADDDDQPVKRSTKKKTKRHQRQTRKRRTHGRSKRQETDSDSSSESSSASDESVDEKPRRSGRKSKQKQKGRSDRLRRRNRRHGRGRRRGADSSSDDSSSESSSSSSGDSESEGEGEQHDESSNNHESSSYSDANDAVVKISLLRAQLDDLQAKVDAEPKRTKRAARRVPKERKEKETKKKKGSKKSKKHKTGYKRVDQLWDESIHDYKLTESAGDKKDQFDGYVFNVRRQFDWENKYKNTVVDVKSKALREALQHVMKDVRGISLVEDKPVIDPNMLFLYLEELRTHAKKTLKARLKSTKKHRQRRRLKTQIAHCKVLVGYLDHDYKETKQTLYPMLEAGNITFDLLWALFKPNTIAFTTTYGANEHPRCFKVDYAIRESSFMRGEWYCIEGRYLEYDGKTHGLGEFYVDVDSFKGARSIASLATYPLAYHKDSESLERQLIERGKKFVSMCGMSYRFQKGLAFVKKKKTVQKVNINGRVMVDPAIFRRINPNYPISNIKAAEDENIFVPQDDDDDSSQACSCCGSDDDDDGRKSGDAAAVEQDVKERIGYKVIEDPKRAGSYQVVEVPVDSDGNMLQQEKIEDIANDGSDTQIKKHVFTDEELLIASPVVLGFAFSEKLWLEFSISSIRDIEWNEGAFDSLMLPTNQKSIVKALVESHKLHAAKTIDDVVQGKGRGLVSVLHGPPGTGKTLTAEGIAELLRCPLYMVSAGELGTQPDRLEAELQKILDIAHSWGAVLLLDEADVFLERREANDIHRNALVSIFLRLLEYFQGILFLTTNRVETFDDAFQSRIHIALRYGELAVPARRAVWKLFLDKVRAMEQSADDATAATAAAAAEANDKSVAEVKDESEESAPPSSPSVEASTPALASSASSVVSSPASTSSKKNPNRPIGDADLDHLARRQLNGRQIKNAVRTAQALAVNEGSKLTAEHVRRVLDVAEQFERDLRGGLGWEDAMRCYT